MAEGVLAGLARWPVKSLGGEALGRPGSTGGAWGATAPTPCSTGARVARAAG